MHEHNNPSTAAETTAATRLCTLRHDFGTQENKRLKTNAAGNRMLLLILFYLNASAFRLNRWRPSNLTRMLLDPL